MKTKLPLALALFVWPTWSNTLELRVDAPAPGAMVSGSFIEVQGFCTPGCAVESRGQRSQADSAGAWALQLATPGRNGEYQISLVATLEDKKQELRIPFHFQLPSSAALPLPPPIAQPQGDVYTADSAQNVDTTLTTTSPALTAPRLRATFFQPQAAGFSDLQLQSYARQVGQSVAQTGGLILEIVSLDSLQAPNTLYRSAQCRDFECALQLGRLNSIDVVVVGRLARRGRGYRLEWTAISTLRGASVATQEIEMGPNLADIEATLQRLGRDLGQKIHATWTVQSGVRTRTSNELHSGTPIRGHLLSGVLSAAASPYLVYGTLSVPANEVLIIEPGVTLYFQPDQYAGIQVFGQLLAHGTEARPIRFLSAAKEPNAWDWNRILFLGPSRSELRHVEVRHSNFGLHVENSALLLQSSQIANNSLRGVFVRNGEALIQDSRIGPEHIVGVQSSAYGKVVLERVVIEGNRNGLALSKLGQMELRNSSLRGNDRGAVLGERASFLTEKSRIEQNQVGISTIEPLQSGMFEGLRNNLTDVVQIRSGLYDRILEDPDVPFADRRPVQSEDFASLRPSGEQKELETWSRFGNIQVGSAYHKVTMERNPGPLAQEDINGLVLPGMRYSNTVSEPGVRTTGSAYMLLESDQGRQLEFSFDGQSSAWNRFYGHPWSLRYASPRHALSLGDFQESGGEISFAGVSLLGAKYLVRAGENRDGEDLLRFEMFAGESRRPLAEGEKNPLIYADHTLENSAIAQEVLASAQITLRPSRLMGFKMGWIGSMDRTAELGPFRTDLAPGTNTRDPLQETRTVFLESDWHSRNRATDLRVQIGLGQADSNDAFLQPAIDRVWAQAGHAAPSLQALRSFFEVPSSIARADSASLSELLPGAEDLSLPEIRDSLGVLRSSALRGRDSLQRLQDEDRRMGFGRDARYLAGRLEWQRRFAAGLLRLSGQYVGDRYYSAGAPGLLQNTRSYEAGWSQSLRPWWDLDVFYALEVENASDGTNSGLNLFGIGEGSRWGLLPDSRWHEQHLDQVRARRTQRTNLEQTWRLGNASDIQLGYSLEHRDGFGTLALRPDVSALAAVHLDPWFVSRSGHSTLGVANTTGDTSQVDSARWSQYLAAAEGDTLASGFREVEWLHSSRLQWGVRLANITLRLGGDWAWLADASRFTRQDLIRDWDLQDSTWGKLGYEFGRRGYWEYGIPLLATTRVGSFASRTSFRPRWRTYSGSDERRDFEWSLAQRVDFPIYRRLVSLALGADLRRNAQSFSQDAYALVDSSGQLYSYYHLDGSGIVVADSLPDQSSYPVSGSEDGGDNYRIERDRETLSSVDWDIILEGTLRFNLSSHMYCEALVRSEEYRRSAQLSQAYRDLSGGVKLFWNF